MEQIARMLARNHGVAVVPDVDALPAVDLQDEIVLLVEVERRDRVRRGDEDPASAVAHSRVDGLHTRTHAFEDFADQSAVNRIDLHVEQRRTRLRSEEHTSELPSLMRTSYAVFCLTNK